MSTAEPKVFSAASEYLKSLNLGKEKSPSLQKTVEWLDPIRTFNNIGRDIPAHLQHWLMHPIETRMFALSDYKYVRKNEDEREWQHKLDTRWRDFSFIIAEELRAFTTPSLAGRGSIDVINKAVGIIAPPPSKK